MRKEKVLKMNNKKINIDVDVSDCMYLDGNYCPNHDTKCDFVDNCYFREYKRKVQECESLESESFTREELISIQEKDIDRYLKALEEIEEIAKDGLNPICYKSNCSRCKCYNGDDCKAGMISLINNYFTENGEFVDGNGDFAEALEDLLDKERSRCNRALPISNKILDIINKTKGKEMNKQYCALCGKEVASDQKCTITVNAGSDTEEKKRSMS